MTGPLKPSAQPHGLRLWRVDPADPDGWWVRFVTCHVFVVLVWIGLGLILTDDVDHRFTREPVKVPPPGQPIKHPESSLGYIHDYLHVPWTVWGVVFLAFAALIVHPRARPVTFFFGAFVASAFVLCVIVYTYLSGNSTNQVVVPLSTLAPDALIACFRYSTRVEHQRTRRRSKRDGSVARRRATARSSTAGERR